MQVWSELINATWQTFYMVVASSAIAAACGIPIGVILFATRTPGLAKNNKFNQVLGSVCNVVRSIPFIILLVLLIPLTRLIVGTSIGTTAAIVPLTIGAIPFIARIVENALDEVPVGLIETGLALGAKPYQILLKILLPEAAASITNGLTVTVITLVGFSAMAGVVGGGGLGDLAIRYGYQRFDVAVMLETVVILILMVQVFQMLGDFTAKKLSHVE